MCSLLHPLAGVLRGTVLLLYAAAVPCSAGTMPVAASLDATRADASTHITKLPSFVIAAPINQLDGLSSDALAWLRHASFGSATAADTSHHTAAPTARTVTNAMAPAVPTPVLAAVAALNLTQPVADVRAGRDAHRRPAAAALRCAQRARARARAQHVDFCTKTNRGLWRQAVRTGYVLQHKKRYLGYGIDTYWY